MLQASLEKYEKASSELMPFPLFFCRTGRFETEEFVTLSVFDKPHKFCFETSAVRFFLVPVRCYYSSVITYGTEMTASCSNDNRSRAPVLQRPGLPARHRMNKRRPDIDKLSRVFQICRRLVNGYHKVVSRILSALEP